MDDERAAVAGFLHLASLLDWGQWPRREHVLDREI